MARRPFESPAPRHRTAHRHDAGSGGAAVTDRATDRTDRVVDRAVDPAKSIASPRAASPEGREQAAAVLEAALSRLAERMSLFSFRGFLEPLRPDGLTIDDNGAALGLLAPSTFLRDWVRDHYLAELEREASNCLGRPVRVTLRHEPVAEPTPAELFAAAQEASAEEAGATVAAILPRRKVRGDGVVALRPPEVRGTRLNPRYTFETFVTGPSNRMAFSAATAVAERPGARYTPLFLFGGTGLGKTHLLHAIGHEVLARHPHLRVASLSAEQWVNEYISDVHNKRFDAFRKRWRDGCDVLLIDDIQFLAGKTASQDEFFHTFNALYESHKQIVVTSDRYPHEIAGLEDRLKTRLQWGLIADIRLPEIDTRRTILDKKSHDLGLALPTDVADFLSSHLTASVRELEGALVRLSAYSHVTREPITLAETKEQLRPMMMAKASEVHVGRVIEVVAAYYGLRSKDLCGPSRQRQVTRARQLAMWLARQELSMSLPEIGRAFGDRDHTTVLSSVRKIDTLQETDAGVQAVVTRLRSSLFG